jgi:formamidopyrimidine-DNA glycosylase
MPEGHSVHRIARQFDRNMVGKRCQVSSPQGRFGDARLIDGHVITRSYAVGKHLFLEFDTGDSLHVHLGLYGAWDFAGNVHHEDSVASIGAPRRRRLRIGESETEKGELGEFPPEPYGQVRARILSADVVADLRGPTKCEVVSPARVTEILDELGPDPLVDSDGGARFVARAKRTTVPIGRVLMNQKMIAGIGNVYRAEMLFRARLNPYTSSKTLTDEVLQSLWKDWVYLLDIGVATGQMLTMDGLTPAKTRAALRSRRDRHWVYRRAGIPCRECGTDIVMDIMEARKLYFCPLCQGVAQ